MARNIFEIKFIIDEAGSEKGSAPAGGAAASTSLPEIRKEVSALTSEIASLAASFKDVAATIKSFPATLKQTLSGAANAASGGVSASEQPSSKRRPTNEARRVPDPPQDDREPPPRGRRRGGAHSAARPRVGTAGEEAVIRAAEEAARAQVAAAAAQEQATEAAHRAARAHEEEASSSKKATGASKDAASQFKDFTDAFSSGFKGVSDAANKVGKQRVGDVSGIKLDAGRVQLQSLFETLIVRVAEDPDLRRQGEISAKKIANLIKIPDFPSDTSKRFKSRVTGLVRRALSDLDDAFESGNFTGSFATQRVRQLRAAISQTADELGNVDQPLEKFTINMALISKTIRAREFTLLADSAKSVAKNLETAKQALAQGTGSPQQVAALKASLGDLTASLFEIIRTELGNGKASILDVVDSLGKELGINFKEAFSPFVEPRVTRVPLQGVQTQAFNILKDTSITDPLKRVQQAIKVLGTDFENLEPNMRAVAAELTAVNTNSRLTAAQLKEVQSLFKFSRSSSGQFQLPKATTQTTAIGLGRSAIAQARQKLQDSGSKRAEISIPTVNAQGQLRTLTVRLTQLGSTLDTIKVKARDVSRNMFDRTSVREALRRVATWGAAAGIVFGAVNAFRTALGVVVETETGIVGLAKVMNEAQADFDGFASKARATAITIAQDFGQPIKDVIETLTLFGQQGLSFPDVQKLTEASALASVATTLDQPTAASALTAAIQQFGLETSDATRVVDSFNKVANENAVTETVLAEALKKAGLAADTAGVSFDQFNGIVAGISTQTRQTGQEIGTALRLIFTRLNTDDAAAGFAKVGIATKDARGEFRGFIPIVSELASQWGSLSQTQRANVAIAAAGTRRYNTFLALLNNFDGVQKATADSTNSLGSALSEQQQVAQTTAFRMQQLKNAAAETALQFGDAFSGTLKTSIDVLQSFLEIVNSIPPSIKGLGVILGATSIAFIKFSDSVSNVLDLAASRGGGGVGLLAGIKNNLSTGVSIEQQNATFSSAKLANLTQASAAAIATPDLIFGKTAAKGAADFNKVLRAQGKILIDNRGKVVSATKSISKFSAISRGFKVGSLNKLNKPVAEAALSFGLLNSGLAKFGAFVTSASTRALRLIPGIGKAVDVLDNRVASASSTFLGLATSVAKVAAAGLLIFGISKGISAISDAITRSGVDIKRDLAEEVAGRQEALNKINEQVSAVKRLQVQQRKTDSSQIITGVQRRQQIAQGTFKSPTVQKIKNNSEQNDLNNSVGFANPELIANIDSLGAVTLKTAAGFTKLSEAANTTQKALLAASKLKIIEGFVGDLKPAEGFFKKTIPDALRTTFSSITEVFDDVGKTLGDSLVDATSRFKEAQDRASVAAAGDLGIRLDFINADDAKRLNEAAVDVQAAAGRFKEGLDIVKSAIADLPTDAGSQQFSRLQSSLGSVAGELAKSASAAAGTRVTERNILNSQFIANRRGISGKTIGTTASETIGIFNEQKVLDQSVAGVDNIRKAIQEATGDRLILFPNAEGIPQQVFLRVTDEGNKVVEFFDTRFGPEIQRSVEDFISIIGTTGASSNLAASIINPQDFEDQITQSLLEVGRIATGAGRGNLLPSEIDLGTDFKFNLTAQQRVAQGDERSVRNLLAAEKELQKARDQIASKRDIKDSGTTRRVDPSELSRVRELSRAFDELATALKFKTVVEEIGRAFEEASDKIDRSKIADKVATEIPTVLGAAAGITPRRSGQIRSRSDLSTQEVVDKLSSGFVRLSNTVVDTQKALAESRTKALEGTRDLGTFFQSFVKSTNKGGANDINRVNNLTSAAGAAQATGGISRSDSAQLALLGESTDIARQQLEVLTQLLDTSRDPKDVGNRLAAAARIAGQGGSAELDKVVNRINNLSSEQLSGISADNLRQVIATVPLDKLSDSVKEAFTIASSQQLAGTAIQRTASASNEAGPGDFIGAARQSIKELLVQVQQSSNTDGGATATAQAIAEVISSRGIVVAGTGPTNDGSRFTSDDIAKVLQGIQADLKGSGSSSAVDVAEAISKGDSAAQAKAVRTLLLQASTVRDSGIKPQQNVQSLTLEERNIASKRAAEAQAALALSASDLNNAISPLLVNIDIFGRSVVKASQSLEQGLSETISTISAGRATRAFSSDRIGALAGVAVAASPSSKSRSNLTGAELTSLENPQLAANLLDANAAFDGILKTLSDIETLRSRAQQQLNAATVEEDTLKIEAASAALQAIGSTADAAAVQMDIASANLKKVGEAFSRLDNLNSLRVGIEKVVSAAKQAQIISQTDLTSFQSATGNTPFSQVQSNFKQASAGQPAFATAFERAILDLKESLKNGTINRQEFNTGTRRAAFERDSGIVALAQRRETGRLQTDVGAAQQIQKQLLSFSQAGGPDSGAARRLFQQITDRIERSGDIIRGGSSRTIRDPNTGRKVSVPASSIRSFRGVGQLDDFAKELAKIADAAKAQEQQKQAAFITDPLIDVLNNGSINANLEKMVGLLSSETSAAAATTVPIAERTQREIRALSSELLSGISKLLTFDNPESAKSTVIGLANSAQKVGPEVAKKLLSADVGNGTSVANLAELQASLANFGLKGDAELTKAAEVLTKLAEGTAVSQTTAAEKLIAAATAQVGAAKELLRVSGTSKFSGASGTAAAVSRFASGGQITGPGGPKSDKVPILASPGEFIINANAVNKVGVGNLNKVNSIGNPFSGKKSPFKFMEGGEVTTDGLLTSGNTFVSPLIDSDIRKNIFKTIANKKLTLRERQQAAGRLAKGDTFRGDSAGFFTYDNSTKLAEWSSDPSDFLDSITNGLPRVGTDGLVSYAEAKQVGFDALGIKGLIEAKRDKVIKGLSKDERESLSRRIAARDKRARDRDKSKQIQESDSLARKKRAQELFPQLEDNLNTSTLKFGKVASSIFGTLSSVTRRFEEKDPSILDDQREIGLALGGARDNLAVASDFVGGFTGSQTTEVDPTLSLRVRENGESSLIEKNIQNIRGDLTTSLNSEDPLSTLKDRLPPLRFDVKGVPEAFGLLKNRERLEQQFTQLEEELRRTEFKDFRIGTFLLDSGVLSSAVPDQFAERAASTIDTASSAVLGTIQGAAESNVKGIVQGGAAIVRGVSRLAKAASPLANLTGDGITLGDVTGSLSAVKSIPSGIVDIFDRTGTSLGETAGGLFTSIRDNEGAFAVGTRAGAFGEALSNSAGLVSGAAGGVGALKSATKTATRLGVRTAESLPLVGGGVGTAETLLGKAATKISGGRFGRELTARGLITTQGVKAAREASKGSSITEAIRVQKKIGEIKRRRSSARAATASSLGDADLIRSFTLGPTSKIGKVAAGARGVSENAFKEASLLGKAFVSDVRGAGRGFTRNVLGKGVRGGAAVAANAALGIPSGVAIGTFASTLLPNTSRAVLSAGKRAAVGAVKKAPGVFRGVKSAASTAAQSFRTSSLSSITAASKSRLGVARESLLLKGLEAQGKVLTGPASRALEILRGSPSAAAARLALPTSEKLAILEKLGLDSRLVSPPGLFLGPVGTAVPGFSPSNTDLVNDAIKRNPKILDIIPKERPPFQLGPAPSSGRLLLGPAPSSGQLSLGLSSPINKASAPSRKASTVPSATKAIKSSSEQFDLFSLNPFDRGVLSRGTQGSLFKSLETVVKPKLEGPLVNQAGDFIRRNPKPSPSAIPQKIFKEQLSLTPRKELPTNLAELDVKIRKSVGEAELLKFKNLDLKESALKRAFSDPRFKEKLENELRREIRKKKNIGGFVADIDSFQQAREKISKSKQGAVTIPSKAASSSIDKSVNIRGNRPKVAGINEALPQQVGLGLDRKLAEVQQLIISQANPSNKFNLEKLGISIRRDALGKALIDDAERQAIVTSLKREIELRSTRITNPGAVISARVADTIDKGPRAIQPQAVAVQGSIPSSGGRRVLSSDKGIVIPGSIENRGAFNAKTQIDNLIGQADTVFKRVTAPPTGPAQQLLFPNLQDVTSPKIKNPRARNGRFLSKKPAPTFPAGDGGKQLDLFGGNNIGSLAAIKREITNLNLPNEFDFNFFSKLFKDTKLKKFATGGSITGPGGPTSDKVPILASPGEFIINAASARKLGTPFLEQLNGTKGNSDFKFAEGGKVGGVSSGGVSVSVDTDSIRQAVEDGIRSALESDSIEVDVSAGATALKDAIQAAFSSIELPDVKLENDTVKLDAPASIPIDASSLSSNLPQSLGADVRRIESLEGSTQGLRQDINEVITRLDEAGASGAVGGDIDGKIETAVQEIISQISQVSDKVDFQKDDILNQAVAKMNEQFNILELDTQTIKHDITTANLALGNSIEQVKRQAAAAEAHANAALSKALSVR